MTPRGATSSRTRAFTLIEVLVVVAIIALLITILLPSLKRARELSRATVCGTRLGQVFKGTLMYTHSNQDRLPYFGWISGRPTDAEWWPTQIARFVGNEYEVYLCPGDPKPFTIDVIYANGSIRMPRSTDQAIVPLKLTWRSACDTLMDTPKGRVPRKLTSWTRPSSAILLVESSSKINSTHGNMNLECFRFKDHLRHLTNVDVLKKQPELVTPWQRHVGKTNLLFIDGHVDRMIPEKVSRLAENQEQYLN